MEKARPDRLRDKGEEAMTDEQAKEQVTDEDIEAIIEQNEAGIADLMAAYEPIEKQYFSAVQVTTPAVTYSTGTASQ